MLHFFQNILIVWCISNQISILLVSFYGNQSEKPIFNLLCVGHHVACRRTRVPAVMSPRQHNQTTNSSQYTPYASEIKYNQTAQFNLQTSSPIRSRISNFEHALTIIALEAITRICNWFFNNELYFNDIRVTTNAFLFLRGIEMSICRSISTNFDSMLIEIRVVI